MLNALKSYSPNYDFVYDLGINGMVVEIWGTLPIIYI